MILLNLRFIGRKRERTSAHLLLTECHSQIQVRRVRGSRGILMAADNINVASYFIGLPLFDSSFHASDELMV